MIKSFGFYELIQYYIISWIIMPSICIPNENLIHDLPGLGFKTNYKQFSGYLNASKGHYLHYWLVESQSNPSTDAIVVWFNGGPGCSSMTGLLYELGPFHVNSDGKTLFENVYAWNKEANVVFIESPVGVGFSYSDDLNYSTGDDQTSLDNYLALKYFFESEFPEYIGRPFFIAGESYGGVYVPLLAKLVTDGTRSGQFPTKLTGIAIGNGILSEIRQHNSIIDFMYFHGLIGKGDWDGLKTCCMLQNETCTAECDFFKYLKLVSGPTVEPWHPWGTDGSFCSDLTYKISDRFVWSSLNDHYNVYQDCYGPPEIQRSLSAEQSFPTLYQYLNTKANNYNSTDNSGGFPCYGVESHTNYLNLPLVQNALNIPENVIRNLPKYGWNICSPSVYLNYKRTNYEMDEVMDNLLKNTDIRIIIFNGDVDMVCNFLGDEWFSDDMAKRNKLKLLQTYSPWIFRDQIAGYVKRWDRLDFLTVKGAGHFVPLDRPGPALQLLQNFVKHTGNYSIPSGFSQMPQPLISSNTVYVPSLVFIFPALIFCLFYR